MLHFNKHTLLLVVALFENKGYIQKSIFTIRLVENNGGKNTTTKT